MNSLELLVLLTILRSSTCSTSTHTNCLIQDVKERFDQVFRLNRGRAFYSSLPTRQALFENFLFYSTACRFNTPFGSLAAGGESYSIQSRCQPPLRTNKTVASSAARIITNPASKASVFYRHGRNHPESAVMRQVLPGPFASTR